MSGLVQPNGMPLSREGYVFKPTDDILVQELAAIIAWLGAFPPLTPDGYKQVSEMKMVAEDEQTHEQKELCLSRHFEKVMLQPVPNGQPFPLPPGLDPNARPPHNRRTS